MPTDSDLRQTAIEVLTRELKKTRVNRTRCEIALACLTELRETAEDQTEPKQALQDFVQEELIRTRIQLEMERKILGGRE